MKALTLLHISDLHFGRARMRALTDALLRVEDEVQPGAVICSGDLVEYAETNGPWRELAAFLARLTSPRLVIPGNHDIERVNLWNRLVRPLGRYHRFVHPEPDHIVKVPGGALVGLGTPRRWSIDLGHVSRTQLAKARTAFAEADEQALRVLAIHHGPRAACASLLRNYVWGASRAVQAFGEMGVDLVLSGHNHFPHACEIEAAGSRFLWSQAGSAGSHRLHKKASHNSVSVIRASADQIAIETWCHDDARGRFEAQEVREFARQRRGQRQEATPRANAAPQVGLVLAK